MKDVALLWQNKREISYPSDEL
jgi:hypothetical protein